MTEIGTKFGLGGGGSGFFGNQSPPKYLTNVFYLPVGYGGNSNTFVTTATRVHYFPLPIFHAHTFQGASTFNGGAADNGEKIRLMVFNDSDGAIGTLAKDFGEITLTGAAAQRNLTSSWAASPGMYWGAVWTETAITMYGMIQSVVNNGPTVADTFGMKSLMLGYFSTLPNVLQDYPLHYYVDTAYGAAPASAVAPTATERGALGTSVVVTPIFALKG